AGQAEPYPRTSGGRKGLTLIDPPGRPLAAPGEPGVAQEVPDRGDDLTPCPLRARRGGEPRGTAVTRGQGDTVTALERASEHARWGRPSEQRVAYATYVPRTGRFHGQWR